MNGDCDLIDILHYNQIWHCGFNNVEVIRARRQKAIREFEKFLDSKDPIGIKAVINLLS